MRYALVSLAMALIVQAGQTPVANLSDRPAKAPAVSFLYPAQVTVAAGKPTPVDLHFKVGSGLHINSHTPGGDELIPTTFTLADTPGVRLGKVDFPPGSDFAFVAGPGLPEEKLSVYTGEFVVHAEVVAARGEHPVQATLRYQACTNNICMPPHSIPVEIDVMAK